MNDKHFAIMDGNEAVTSVAHRCSEVVAIYPITPASTMGELCDEWSAKGRLNLFGQVPHIAQLQSEAGAAGSVHGALQAGALTTTFTASQGLLLMIPNMYKIAGELLPFCLHVAARTLATHALSIFGDHSDVMSCRQTGFAMLCSASVQEAHDMAAIAHAATLRARVPFLHFFDGFRTSHEIARVEMLPDDTLRALLDDEAILAHRRRALSPDHPVLRGTAQNPDVYFQAREACNPFYDACPSIVADVMDRFAALTGRRYRLFDYVGHPQAERVIIIMGSGGEAVHETVDYLTAHGERVGVLKVRLFRPFDLSALCAALPASVKRLAVLDRTKEPGAVGDPLYMDVVTALQEARVEGLTDLAPRIVGGRYGLSSKEFTPAMVKAVFDELQRDRPRAHFTVGINDDVTRRSLPYDPTFSVEGDDVVRAVFYGLGSDGTVGSNKNTAKIVGEETDYNVQGYFVYDSKKSGAITVSHLRFSPRPIRSTYLVNQASFVACHQTQFIDQYDFLHMAAPGATVVLNTPHSAETVWDTLPIEVQESLISHRARLYVIDAYQVAENAELGRHLSTVMQTCFFALSGILPRETAIAKIKYAIEKTYGKRGTEVVRRNFAAVDQALDHLHEVKLPATATATRHRPPKVPAEAPDFVQRVTAVMLAGQGDLLPVSAFPVDGTWPTATSRWERRSIAQELPVWDPGICIQCNKCALVCPHAAIRTAVFPPAQLDKAPAGYPSMDYKSGELAGMKYAVQVAPDDCTGCGLCVAVCPGKEKANPRHKAIDMKDAADHRDIERPRFEFFRNLPEPDRTLVPLDVKGSQLLVPLFEFSGACAGCGETPYIKLLTQLFGDRLLIANATGCSSIYGGNLPTTPYCQDQSGRGPAWANSLFEDNAEFGLGMRLALDSHTDLAHVLMKRLGSRLPETLITELLTADQKDAAGVLRQRERVAALKQALRDVPGTDARRMEALCDYLVKKVVWIVGGDGWAYDIGYGGLDHVLSTHHDLNILVLDTEVYSNTGGQQSKSTPMGAAAKFAAAGKDIGKKDLGMAAMAYGHVYVSQVAFGAKDAHTVKTFLEAESYQGPSLIIAYSHCIAHGYDMIHGLDQQRLAVDTGIWPLYRYDPRRTIEGEPPLKLDSGPLKGRPRDFMANEGRFRQVQLQDPTRYQHLLDMAEANVKRRRAMYEQLAAMRVPADKPQT